MIGWLALLKEDFLLVLPLNIVEVWGGNEGGRAPKQSFQEIFYQNVHCVSVMQENALALSGVHENLCAKLAQGFLDTMHIPGMVSGGCGLAVACQLLQEEGLALHIISSDDPIEMRLLLYLEERFLRYGLCAEHNHAVAQKLLDRISVCGGDNKGNMQRHKGYVGVCIKGILGGIGIDEGQRQKCIRENLKMSWKIEDVEANTVGYQNVMMAVMHRVFELDAGLLKYQSLLLDFLSYPVLHKTDAFFMITSSFSSHSHGRYTANKRTGVSLPLQEAVNAMLPIQRRCLLFKCIREKARYMKQIPILFGVTHLSLSFYTFAFEGGFLEKVAHYCAQWLRLLESTSAHADFLREWGDILEEAADHMEDVYDVRTPMDTSII